jgi:hypothetical protein
MEHNMDETDNEIQPDLPETEAQDDVIEAQKPRSRRGLVIGAGLVMVLLMAAAFVGGRLLKGGPGAPGIGLPGGAVFNGEGGGMVSMEIRMEPAPELPDAKPDASGMFLRRQDNSFFIGTGSMGVAFSISSDSGEKPAVASAPHDGPEVEVVVNNTTVVYKDDSFNDGPPEDGVIQQKVSPGSIEEIGENSALTVWGRKVGDRLIADVLLYSEPMFISAPVK